MDLKIESTIYFEKTLTAGLALIWSIMMSSGADFLRHERSWVELLRKTNRYRIGRTRRAPHFPKVTLVFNFRH